VFLQWHCWHVSRRYRKCCGRVAAEPDKRYLVRHFQILHFQPLPLQSSLAVSKHVSKSVHLSYLFSALNKLASAGHSWRLLTTYIKRGSRGQVPLLTPPVNHVGGCNQSISIRLIIKRILGAKGACPPRCQTLCNMTLKQHNAGVHCNKNAISDIKLCLLFSPGLKFQVVYFKKCSSFWGTPSPIPRPPNLALNSTF